jgi:hypothetical protein
MVVEGVPYVDMANISPSHTNLARKLHWNTGFDEDLRNLREQDCDIPK